MCVKSWLRVGLPLDPSRHASPMFLSAPARLSYRDLVLCALSLALQDPWTRFPQSLTQQPAQIRKATSARSASAEASTRWVGSAARRFRPGAAGVRRTRQAFRPRIPAPRLQIVKLQACTRVRVFLLRLADCSPDRGAGRPICGSKNHQKIKVRVIVRRSSCRVANRLSVAGSERGSLRRNKSGGPRWPCGGGG